MESIIHDSSCAPFLQASVYQVSAFDPFTPDLQLLQRQDNELQAIFNFLKNGTGHDSISKQTIRTLAAIAPKVFFDKNKLTWIRLEDHNYPHTALWLPERCRIEAHDSVFAGNNAALKSYIKPTTSYYWPTVYSHVLKHKHVFAANKEKQLNQRINL